MRWRRATARSWWLEDESLQGIRLLKHWDKKHTMSSSPPSPRSCTFKRLAKHWGKGWVRSIWIKLVSIKKATMDVMKGTEVVRVDSEDKCVLFSNESNPKYSKMPQATGWEPRKLQQSSCYSKVWARFREVLPLVRNNIEFKTSWTGTVPGMYIHVVFFIWNRFIRKSGWKSLKIKKTFKKQARLK